MTRLDAAGVIAASNAWTWYPDTATVVETDDYLLVRFPDFFNEPLVLDRLTTDRPVALVLGEVLQRAREFELDRILIRVKPDAPAGLEELVVAGGGRLHETVDILALSLAAAPAFDPPADVEVRWRVDQATAADAARVFRDVWKEGEELSAERLAALGEEGARDLPAGRGGVAVAYLDGRPVGAAGVSPADGAARLWGAAVVEGARGRGAYRALLDARTAYGREHGATMALVKGKVDTSGPILRRAGFEVFGQERSYRLPLD